MSENCSHRDAQACGGAIRHGSVYHPVFLLLVVLVLLRTSHALADEQPSIAAGPLTPDFNAGPAAGRGPSALTPMLPLPGTYQAAFDLPRTYQATDSAEGDLFLRRDFRPRGPSVLERQSQVAATEDLPMLHGTSVWQRLADYRSHGRVRLLTLWETGGSIVSLQAGKKGEPSLQWTSRSMNHGGATRGLFDQLVTVSMAGANRSFHPVSHPSPSEAAPRPGKPAEVGMGANK